MKRKKHLLIFPGFGHTPSQAEYRSLHRIGTSKGYIVKTCPIEWSRTTMRDWVAQCEFYCKNIDTKNTTVVGFSFGAMIATVLAQRHPFKKIILASLSPYFKDDLRFLPVAWKKWLGVRRRDAFSKTPFLSHKKVSAVFLVGDKEGALILRRVKKRFSSWRGSKKLVLLSGVEHDLNNKTYLDSIRGML